MHPIDDAQALAQIIGLLRHNDIHLQSPTYLHHLKIGNRSDRETVALLTRLETDGLITYKVDASDGSRAARGSSELELDKPGQASPLVHVCPAEPATWRKAGYSDNLDAPRVL